MKAVLFLAGVLLGVLSVGSAVAAPNVNVIVNGQVAPGVYGRVEIGNIPAPPVLYPQPVVIVRPPRPVVVVEPMYLHVPPGHAKNWRKHCYRYNACGQPVYFVRSQEYEPGYGRKHKHKHHDDRERSHGRGQGKSKD
jgi:hypothetical protein